MVALRGIYPSHVPVSGNGQRAYTVIFAVQGATFVFFTGYKSIEDIARFRIVEMQRRMPNDTESADFRALTKRDNARCTYRKFGKFRTFEHNFVLIFQIDILKTSVCQKFYLQRVATIDSIRIDLVHIGILQQSQVFSQQTLAFIGHADTQRVAYLHHL